MLVPKDENMRIWYDALTGKHLRYGVAIAKKLRELGHEVVLTTRRHPDTIPLANYLNEKCLVVGSYNPKSLLTRLVESNRRQLAFCRLFSNSFPDIAISHGSVDQCRVAFGVGKTVISTIDTPYAEAVHRLTLPISDYVVSSKAIPEGILRRFNAKGKIASFNGVDETAWIKGFKPETQYSFGRPLIVVRQFEEKAAYAEGRVDLHVLARKLARLGKVVFLSRYGRKKTKNLIIPREFIDTSSLVSTADLFVGVGGTITREAALQGTPAIIIKALPTQHVNDFLISKGFPIFKSSSSDVVKLAARLLNRKFDVRNLLNELENPADTIANIVKNLAGQQK